MASGVSTATRETAKRGLEAATSWLREPVDRGGSLELLDPHVVWRADVEPVVMPPSPQHGGPPRFQRREVTTAAHDDVVAVVDDRDVDGPLRLTRFGGMRVGRQLLDLDFGTASGLLELPSPRTRRILGEVVAPWSHHWGDRYYDWTVMVLAKLVRIEQALGAERFRAAHLALVHAETSFARWYLGELGVLDRVVAPDRGPRIAPQRVVVGNNQAWFRPSRADLRRLRARFLHDRPAPPLGRRLYLQRTGRRRVANEDALLPVLRRHGVVVVEDGRFGVADQVALFRDAELVVAPHGAGLTNLVWAQQGTRVLELLTAGFAPDPFRYLCAAMGHQHHVLVDGDAVDDVHAAHGPVDHANVGEDVHVDPALLDRALTDLG